MYIYCNIWYVRDGACGLLYAPTPADPPIQKYIRKYKKKKSTKPKNIFRYLSPTSLIHVSYHIATNCVPRHVCPTW